ncbi:MAG: hypothetical protein HKO71_01655, partial [Pseudomonadales bacterium]|nr:hypothetical protein [Pseudomonadales bacterium]
MQQRAPSSIKLSLAALLFVLLAYKLWVAACEGLAELYVVPASTLMDSWEEISLNGASLNGQSGELFNEETQPFVPPHQAYDAVLNNLQIAAKLSPKNPIYQDELARLLLFKLYDSALDVPDIESTGVEVVNYLRQAAYYRPTWPYHWMDIAYTQYQLYR